MIDLLNYVAYYYWLVVVVIIIIIMHIVFQFDPSSVLCVICEYSVMSKVTRAYPLLVWGVTLGLLPSCKVGGTHQPGRAGMQ